MASVLPNYIYRAQTTCEEENLTAQRPFLHGDGAASNKEGYQIPPALRPCQFRQRDYEPVADPAKSTITPKDELARKQVIKKAIRSRRHFVPVSFGDETIKKGETMAQRPSLHAAGGASIKEGYEIPPALRPCQFPRRDYEPAADPAKSTITLEDVERRKQVPICCVYIDCLE